MFRHDLHPRKGTLAELRPTPSKAVRQFLNCRSFGHSLDSAVASCRMRILVCTLAATVLSVGCAKDGDSTHKELAAIQQELVRMRAENAILAARIEALETTRARQATSEAPAKAAAIDDDRPPLGVLRLVPTPEASSTTDKPRAGATNDAPPADEPEEDEPRPIIRSTGRGEVVAQTPRTSKPTSQPRPATTRSGTPR